MKRVLIMIVALGWLGFHHDSVAQTETAPAPASAPTSAPASEESKEYELPEGPEGVIAEVGDIKIMAQDLTAILDKTPYRLSKKKRREIWESSLGAFLYNGLLHSYLEANKAPDAPDEVAALKGKLAEEVEKYNETASFRLLPEITVFELMEQRGLNEQRLNDYARYEKLMGAMISNEELLAFMNKHPEYFNGTKVHIGHILIASSPLAPTAEQKKAVEKLQQIAADIRAGKTTFAEAAHEFSQCPSGKRKGSDGTADYGDLGSVTFPQLAGAYGASLATMVFDADTGSICDIVRSNQGFHLVKVYERTEGNEPPSAASADIARMAVSTLVENQIYNQALDQAPIVIYKAAKKVPKPKKD